MSDHVAVVDVVDAVFSAKVLRYLDRVLPKFTGYAAVERHAVGWGVDDIDQLLPAFNAAHDLA